MAGQKIDGCRLDQRFIALNVDDRSSIPIPTGSCYAVGATGAFHGCHLSGTTESLDSIDNALVVGQDNDSIELNGLLGPAINMLDQWPTRQ